MTRTQAKKMLQQYYNSKQVDFMTFYGKKGMIFEVKTDDKQLSVVVENYKILKETIK